MIEINVSKGIKVGGFHFKVKAGNHISERLKEGNFYGRCYHKEKEILLDNSCTPEQVSSTFIHEVLHAVDDAYCGGKLSEKVNTQLANGIHQVMESLGVRFVR